MDSIPEEQCNSELRLNDGRIIKNILCGNTVHRDMKCIECIYPELYSFIKFHIIFVKLNISSPYIEFCDSCDSL